MVEYAGLVPTQKAVIGMAVSREQILEGVENALEMIGNPAALDPQDMGLYGDERDWDPDDRSTLLRYCPMFTAHRSSSPSCVGPRRFSQPAQNTRRTSCLPRPMSFRLTKTLRSRSMPNLGATAWFT